MNWFKKLYQVWYLMAMSNRHFFIAILAQAT
jgi:hypothetical protein